MSQTKVIYNSLSPPDGWRVPGAELELQTLIIFKLKLGVLCRARPDTAAAQASHRHDSGKLCRACSASFTKHEGGEGEGGLKGYNAEISVQQRQSLLSIFGR